MEITTFFEDREPAGPYGVTVPARRTLHVRSNKLEDRRASSMNAKAQVQSSPYWLITGCETHRIEVLTIDFPGTAKLTDGEKALPVFRSREDAEGFLEFMQKDGSPRGGFSVAAAGGGWRIRETTRGELLSLLCGACAGVGRVLLDPSPGIDAALMAELVGVGREDFMDRLLGRGRAWFYGRYQIEKGTGQKRRGR